MEAHNKATDDLPVHCAIRKYGKITEGNVEILEEVPISLLREKEKYWINYYKSYLPEIGYNLTLGGDGASPGVYNVSAKLDQKRLDNLVQELIENKIYIKDLSKKYNLSPESISEINSGKHYFNPNLKYPLRKNTKFTSEQMKGITGINKGTSKFSKKELEEIINLLRNSSLSLKKIAEIFNCTYPTISYINRGIHYPDPNIDYPIRKERYHASKLSDADLEEIQKLLQNTRISFKDIAIKFNVSSSTIERINSGKYHFNKENDYPMRKTINNK